MRYSGYSAGYSGYSAGYSGYSGRSFWGFQQETQAVLPIWGSLVLVPLSAAFSISRCPKSNTTQTMLPPVSFHPLVHPPPLPLNCMHRASSLLGQLATLSPVARRTTTRPRRPCPYYSCSAPHDCVSTVVSWPPDIRGISHSCSARSRCFLLGQHGEHAEQSCAFI